MQATYRISKLIILIFFMLCMNGEAQSVLMEHPLVKGLAAWYPSVDGFMPRSRMINFINNSNGTLLNGASWGGDLSGRFGGVLKFDGTDDYADLGQALTSTTAFTTCLHLRPASTPEYMHLLAKTNEGEESGWDVQTGGTGIATATDIIAWLKIPGISSRGQTSSGLLTSGTWRCLCIVYNGGQTADATRLLIYIDGQAQSLSFLSAPVPAAIGSTTAPVTLAFPAQDSSNSFFNGTMRNVFLSQRPLTPTEVNGFCKLRGPDYSGMLTYDDLIAQAISVSIKKRVQMQP